MRETSEVIGVLIQQKPLVSIRIQAVKLHRNNISTFSISSSQIVYGWTRKTFEGGIFLALYKTKYVKLFTPRLNQLVSKELVSKRLVTATTFHSRKQFAWLFVWINQVETGLSITNDLQDGGCYCSFWCCVLFYFTWTKHGWRSMWKSWTEKLIERTVHSSVSHRYRKINSSTCVSSGNI